MVISQDLKRKLRSEIYQLQVECDRLADEVDQWSDPGGTAPYRYFLSALQYISYRPWHKVPFSCSLPTVPLGETNEKFYQHIYTGQPLPPRSGDSNPPPLPSQPPVWQSELIANNIDGEERDGPSWVCRMCTFDNHPLMNKCEQCDMPRLLDHGNTGTTLEKAIEDLTSPLTRLHMDPPPPEHWNRVP